jgi:phage terminase small subunit
MRRLTLKLRKFGLAYVGEANGNGTEAARVAGYKGNDVTLSAVAHENLRKPQIVSFIAMLRSEAEKQAAGKILSATEVLVGLTRIARADLAEVFEPDGRFDLQAAKNRDVSRLIKSMKFDKDTGKLTHIELHSAHGAHVDLGKYHKLFTEKHEHGGEGGGPITVKVVYETK